jgi:hypothetical protein
MLPWDGKTEFGIDRAEWERRVHYTVLAFTALSDALPADWVVGDRGVATREDLLHELLGIIWVARHDPDEKVAKYHILRKLGVLMQLYMAFSQLDSGEVHHLLRPRQVNNRPPAATAKVVVMAILAATYRALTALGTPRNEAARKVAAISKNRWRPSDVSWVTPAMVYRYWRRLRSSLEYEWLLQIIMSGGRCSPEYFTASRAHPTESAALEYLRAFNPSESSVIKEATATLDRFLRARSNCR